MAEPQGFGQSLALLCPQVMPVPGPAAGHRLLLCPLHTADQMDCHQLVHSERKCAKVRFSAKSYINRNAKAKVKRQMCVYNNVHLLPDGCLSLMHVPYIPHLQAQGCCWWALLVWGKAQERVLKKFWRSLRIKIRVREQLYLGASCVAVWLPIRAFQKMSELPTLNETTLVLNSGTSL